jgi:type VI secretion system protein ImpK
MRSEIHLPEDQGTAQGESQSVRKLDRLALLYEGILTAVCRVHTGRQRVQDPEDFLERMKQALAEVESTAARRGYGAEDVHESTFAVVAFLDEVILTASGTSAVVWKGESLGQVLFGQRSAGEDFFKRLDVLRANRDSHILAEILEVYYLCLLLGYEGKFAGASRGELLQIMGNLRERIERILGRDLEFSPDKALAPVPPAAQITVDLLHRQLRLFGLAAMVFAFLCYVVFSIQLHMQSSSLNQAIENRLSGGGAP